MKKRNETGFAGAVGEMKKALASAYGAQGCPSALRDNAYLLKSTASAVSASLLKSGKLPTSGKYPRIYIFLEDYISLCGAICAREKLDELFAAASAEPEVTGDEIAVFFDVLKLVLLKKIFRFAEKPEGGASVR